MAAVLSTVLSPEEALREARELLAAVHDMPRHWPTVEQAAPVSADEWGRALHAAEKRASGAPLQYAAGRASFRHLTLDVDERVLIPRPETELLVDLVMERVESSHELAVDVGTGSGAIALALASEGSFTEVVGTDLSLDALAVAEANARLLRSRGALRARVVLAHGSLLAPLHAKRWKAHVVVSNPPYIAF